MTKKRTFGPASWRTNFAKIQAGGGGNQQLPEAEAQFGQHQQQLQPAMNGFAMAPGHGGFGGPQQQPNQPAAMNGFAMAPGGMFGHGGFGGPQQQPNQPGMHGQGVVGGGGPAAQLHGAQAAVAAGQQQQQMFGQPNPPANNANWTHCADGTVTTEFLNSIIRRGGRAGRGTTAKTGCTPSSCQCKA